MLERSKNAPLDVTFDSSIFSTRAHPQLLAAMSHSERLRSVELVNGNHKCLRYPELLRALGQAAPNLQSLILSAAYSVEVDAPKVFTMGGAPRLKVLKLARFNFEWHNIPLGNVLTSLHLQPHTFNTRPTWDAFLQPLSKMQFLKHLKLHRVLPSEAFQQEDPHALSLPITLPTLEDLTIEARVARGLYKQPRVGWLVPPEARKNLLEIGKKWSKLIKF